MTPTDRRKKLPPRAAAVEEIQPAIAYPTKMGEAADIARLILWEVETDGGFVCPRNDLKALADIVLAWERSP